MATVTIDNRPYDVDPERNLLDVCLSLGLDLPYFCWHPALGSVGACRQCAVTQYRDANDTRGRVVMACMTPAKDGTRIGIADVQSTDFRARVIEWLMTNHPHDCPVCEEGSECHLQDMTVMTGHVYRRYHFRKRTFRNQDLGPFLTHEMNRCITCYRCVRFYGDYAGGTDLRAFASKNHVYFGREADGILQNEFSGNLAEVCPTGVFDDKTFSTHYTRKWDLQSAPSVCVHCSIGCNVHANERYGELRRILNRYHADINRYFICDRGRYGYAFVNSVRRVRMPLLRDGAHLRAPATREVAITSTAQRLHNTGRIVGIGSPRASLETNFALRTLVGADHFYDGLSVQDRTLVGAIHRVLQHSPVPIATLQDAEMADAVLVLGEDVANTAPRMGLALRQAVRQRAFAHAHRLGIAEWQDMTIRDVGSDLRSPLFILTSDSTRLDDVATLTWHGAPDDLARLGFAIAHALDPRSPPVSDLDADEQRCVRDIARALHDAQRPLVVSGTGASSEDVIAAATNVALALHRVGQTVRACYVVPECNSLGIAALEGHPMSMLLEDPTPIDAIIVVENDLYRRATRAQVDRLLARARYVIVLDHLMNDTIARADAIFPAGTFAESDGTLVNYEGRAQRFFQVFVPVSDICESWRWLRDLAHATGRGGMDWDGLDAVTRACAEAKPALAGIVHAAPPASLRVAGMKIAREPARYSGRTAIHADLSVHEPPPPADPDSALAFSMEGDQADAPAALIPYFWAPRWNSIQSLNKFQEEIGGRLRDGGPTGVRLFPMGDNLAYATHIPARFRARADAWRLLPLYLVFGSDETSDASPAVASRIPRAHVALNPHDASALDAIEGTRVDIVTDAGHLTLPVRLHPALPAGVAGLPAGLTETRGIPLPAWARVARAPV